MDRAVELGAGVRLALPRGLPQCLASTVSREIEPVVKVNADMTIADGRYMTATFGC